MNDSMFEKNSNCRMHKEDTSLTPTNTGTKKCKQICAHIWTHTCTDPKKNKTENIKTSIEEE